MRQRRGFTLVELMVAVALTLFIMVILSEAFIVAIETFSQLKGLGDMQVNLRTALTTLREDLNQDHFEGKRRISDPTFLTDPPREGFFSLYQKSASQSEGSDPNGVASYRAIDHVIHCAVKRRGNRRESFFSTTVGDPSFKGYYLQGSTTPGEVTLAESATTFSSQWAEVAYFLVKTGTTSEPNNPNSTIGTPLYGLYRAQLVVVPYVSSSLSGNTYSQSGFNGVACNTNSSGGLTFYSPNDLAVNAVPPATPSRTLQPSVLVAGGSSPAFQRAMAASTLLLPNVVSFDVQVLRTPAAGTPTGSYTDLTPPGSTPPPPPWSYDSAAPPFGLLAVQITLRVWDPRSMQARQATLVQDL